MRIGIGYDVHAFAEGRPLVLGGIEIPAAQGLSGHSDADVVCHAIADAILGACNLGDLGDHFPNTDEWAGASGLSLLLEVRRLSGQAGWKVGNVDASIVAESPKLAGHRDAMRAAIAGALEVGSSDVSIKATTADGLGSIGRGEGIACIAVAVVEPLV